MMLLLKGIILGLLFGVPAGSVGALTMQRTLVYGKKAGIVTGLGSSIADSLYAMIGAFGFTVISDFLFEYQLLIFCIGGLFILYISIKMFFSLPENTKVEKGIHKENNNLQFIFSSFVIGITNPAAIMTFLFAYSWFNIKLSGTFDGIILTIGIFTGTFIWWIILSGTAEALKKRFHSNMLNYVNKGFGTILFIFSLIIFIRTFFMLTNKGLT